MTPTTDGPVIVVGGGAGFVGRAVVGALLADGARVVVPTRREEDAERFYLEASPGTVPRLRTAAGDFGDPATPGRIAAVARREFGGVDHLVSVIGSPPLGPLASLDARGVQQAVEDNLSAPGRFLLGMLRHLDGPAPVKRVVAVTPAPGHEAGAGPDAWSLGRTFVEGLIALLREARRPGLELYALRAPRLAGTADGAAAVGRAVARLLAEGAPRGARDLVVEMVAPDDVS
jgi:NAD(P)-dependent dehydrogenase (short-subunit alcohol dehydrogenase family)